MKKLGKNIISDKLISKYDNGNYTVRLFDDGTKIRDFKEIPKPLFPESIDLKITNYCNLENICKWCHEDSTTKGKHSSLEDYFFLLEQLPSGVELAIGSGNPLSHPNIESFLIEAKKNGIVCNMTVDELHLKKYKDLITRFIKQDLIKGVGISFQGKFLEELDYFCNLTDNVVFHLIMGVHKLEDIDIISQFSKKILILGYKEFRRGIDYYNKEVEDIKYQWYIRLPLYFNKMILSFDNLAIKQLNLEKFFPDESWDQFYMGVDDNNIDAVENKFAKSSISNNRMGVDDNNIEKMFEKIINE